MIGQHCGQHLDISQELTGGQSQGLQSSRKRFFSRGKHGERALRLQRVEQASGLHSGDQRRELARRNRHIHQITKNHLSHRIHSLNNGFGSRRRNCHSIAVGTTGDSGEGDK